MSFNFESINVDTFVNAYLPQEKIDAWYATRSGRRFLGHQNKRLVIFTFEDETPVVKDYLTCEGVEISATEGMASFWRSAEYEDLIKVSHTPVEVAKNVFLYHTFESSVNYRRVTGAKYAINFSMVYRSRHSPLKVKEPGFDYVMENKVFSTTFGV